MRFCHDQKGRGQSTCSALRFSIAFVLFYLGLGPLTLLRAEEPTVLKGHEAGVCRVAFSPDGRTLVTAAWDGIFKVWDPAAGKVIEEVDAHESCIFSLSFTPDGTILATGCGNRKERDFTVKLWDTKTWKELPPVEGGHPGYIQAAGFLDGGKFLAAGTAAGWLRVWDVSTRKLRYSHAFDALIFAFDVCPEGKVLALIHSGGQVRLWDVAAEKEVAQWQVGGPRGYGVRCSPDGKALATVAPRVVELWDLTGKALANWKPEERLSPGGALAFSPDGRILAASDNNGSVYLLDSKTLRELGSVHAHRRSALALAFSPDGKRLVTGGDDKLVRIWDVAKLLEAAAPKK